MSNVAMDLVATMNNSQLGNNNGSNNLSNTNFSKTLEKYMAKEPKGRLTVNVEDIINKRNEKLRGASNNVEQKEVIQDTVKGLTAKTQSINKVIEKIDEISKEVNKSLGEVAKTEGKTIEEISEEVLAKVSEILGIPQEVLLNFLENNNLGIKDLFNDKTIVLALEEIHLIKEIGELLTNPEMMTKFKEILSELEKILEKYILNE